MRGFISFLLALVVFSALPALPAQAQEEERMVSPRQQAAPLGGARAQRLRAQQQAAPEEAEPLPADTPSTSRNGEDLVVQSSAGNYTVAGFFAGMREGEARPFTMNQPGGGSCVAQIDFSGAVVDMACR
ncbi:MAG: hypothetical protein EPN97_11175 [Alphaproteobacteria bacterium]|nr:MAG: hypothetical protein EPN97_11175 [Alphaproteobacteria bacterium]